MVEILSTHVVNGVELVAIASANGKALFAYTCEFCYFETSKTGDQCDPMPCHARNRKDDREAFLVTPDKAALMRLRGRHDV